MSNKNTGKVAQDVPDDVWVEIMGHKSFSAKDFSGKSRDALRSLSSTSKRMRRIAVPILYQTLNFKASLKRSPTTLPSLIRSHMRARFFIHSPHLLRHVRKLELHGWERETTLTDSTMIYFTRETMWGDDLSDDAKNLIAGIYHSITCLIPHMEGLLQVELFGSRLTSYLNSAIYTLPRLTKLFVTSPPWKFWADIPVEPPRSLAIRGFGFYHAHSIEYNADNRQGQILADILRYDMTGLEVLHVCPVTPVSVIRISNLKHRLRYLHIDFAGPEIPDYFRVFTPWNAEAKVLTPHHLLTLIESLSVFQNLERLRISYYFDGMLWHQHAGLQESWKTLLNLLGRLERLHTCKIYPLYGDIDGYDIGCPVGQEGDPYSQGNFSLKTIAVGFLSNHVWNWNDESGWVQGEGSASLCLTNWWDELV